MTTPLSRFLESARRDERAGFFDSRVYATAIALVEKLAAYVEAYAALNCGTIDDECGSPECPVCSARATLTECAALAEKEAPR